MRIPLSNRKDGGARRDWQWRNQRRGESKTCPLRRGAVNDRLRQLPRMPPRKHRITTDHYQPDDGCSNPSLEQQSCHDAPTVYRGDGSLAANIAASSSSPPTPGSLRCFTLDTVPCPDTKRRDG